MMRFLANSGLSIALFFATGCNFNLAECFPTDPGCGSMAPALLYISQAQSVSARPDELANLRLWLDANNLGLNDGDPVSAWSDLSGAGNDATQSTGGEMPAYYSTAFGGLPAVHFDGSATPGNNLILGSNYIYSSTDGLSILAVVRSDAEDQISQFIVDFGLNSDAGYGLSYSANTDGVSDNMLFYTSIQTGGQPVFAATQALTTDRVVVSGRIGFASTSGPHQSIFINGSRVATNTNITQTQLTEAEICESDTRGVASGTATPFATCTSSTNAGPVTIGGQSKTNGETGRFFNGDMALILIYDRALIDDELSLLECYASERYGLGLSYCE